MGYDIPDKIRYREKIFMNLDMRQLGYVIGFLIIAAFAYGLPIVRELRFLLAFLILSIGAGFAFFDFETKLLEITGYYADIRLGGTLDKKVRDFIGVRKIERNALYLKDGELRAILQVTPVNFELLDETRQKSLILNYREFLNQLTFPVQIVIRTVNTIKPDYSLLDARVERASDDDLKALFHEFRVFEEKFIQENFVKERLYYLVIPMECRKTLINGKFREEDQLKELEQRVQLIQERLLYCGLVSFRLTTSSLVSLLMSYFDTYIEVGDDYLSRITVYKSFNTSREVR